MSSKSTITNQKHLLYRIAANGYKETVWYTGSLRNKPKGWKVNK